MNPEKILDSPSYFVEEFIGDSPFGYQKDFMDHPSSRKIFSSGRRVGKSTTASWLALWFAVTYGNSEILITAKAQRQSMELFNEVKSVIRKSDISEEEWGIARSTRTEINFSNGSRILCLPVGQDGSNIRGYGTDLMIVDEAAFIEDHIFQEVLMPMLAVGESQLVLLSTPFGKKGFFYRMFEKSLDEDSNWYSKQVPTSANPLIDDNFIEEQRDAMTRTQFKQEILGEFDENISGFFTRDELEICAVPDTIEKESDVCFLGVDLAASGADESVYISIDVNGNIFDIEHTHNKPLTDAMGRVREKDHQHNYSKILVDSTGLGEGVVDQLKETVGRKVEGFKFTNEKKQSLYNTAKRELQEGNIAFKFVPGKNTEPGNKLFNQCLDLEKSYTSTGKTKISHPEGGHDDFSDSLVLAIWAKSQKQFARNDGSMKPFNLGSLRD